LFNLMEEAKNALITLQGQSRTAVEGLLEKISRENHQLEKLETVLRDMKQVLKQQQQANNRLETQIASLQKELFAEESITDDEAMSRLRCDVATMSPQELLQHIDFLARKVVEETQRTQRLQLTIQQLQQGIKLLSQKLDEILQNSS